MHNVFISLFHSLSSITNTNISPYPTIEKVHKVTVIDLYKAFDTNNNKASINH